MPFEISVDPQRNRVSVTLTDFISVEDVMRFEGSLNRAIAQLSYHRRPHQLLYDVSGAKVQSQEVVKAARELTVRSQRTAAFALVSASTLAGRQLRRIFEGVPVHICQNRNEAIDWLDAQSSG